MLVVGNELRRILLLRTRVYKGERKDRGPTAPPSATAAAVEMHRWEGRLSYPNRHRLLRHHPNRRHWANHHGRAASQGSRGHLGGLIAAGTNPEHHNRHKRRHEGHADTDDGHRPDKR
jgi:hypothetical protein